MRRTARPPMWTSTRWRSSSTRTSGGIWRRDEPMKRTKYASRNIREGYLLIAPLLAGALLFYAAPFLLVLRNSVFRGISHSEQFVGLQNFRDIPANEVFRLAFGNTLKFLLVSIPLIIIISFAVALLLR